jgi:hypothetical protein
MAPITSVESLALFSVTVANSCGEPFELRILPLICCAMLICIDKHRIANPMIRFFIVSELN